ncbi:MAG: hypothetical protein ACI89U_001917, partial [Gammaproteobacteria bacterium]
MIFRAHKKILHHAIVCLSMPVAVLGASDAFS